MTATITLPAPPVTARRAERFFAAWTADAELPEVYGCTVDAVCVLAVRAALYAETGDERVAALAAPAAVELSGRLLDASFPELERVAARSGARIIHGHKDGRWTPGDYLHQVYIDAFGEPGGRCWPV